MREIEAKILEVDGKQLKARLKKLGAKKTFQGKIDSIFFDFPNNSLRKSRTILRLRTEGSKAILTVKKKRRKGRLKNLEELETSVSDFSEAGKMLHSIGLVEKLRIKKTRTSFRLGPAGIELDKIPSIPLFAEIEAGSEKKVLEIAKRLGFRQKQLLPWNMLDVIKHYRK